MTYQQCQLLKFSRMELWYVTGSYVLIYVTFFTFNVIKCKKIVEHLVVYFHVSKFL